MNRGVGSTVRHCEGTKGTSGEDLHAILLKFYAKEPFVHVLPFGQTPQTRHVRGSERDLHREWPRTASPDAPWLVSALDNLVKGTSPQAVQNINLMLGYQESFTGLEQVALFP